MRESDLYLLVNRWKDGKVTADEAMKEIALSLSKPKPVKKKRTIEHDVTKFLKMADAIVESRKSSL